MKFYKKRSRLRTNYLGSQRDRFMGDDWMDEHPLFCGCVAGFLFAFILFIGLGI